jgi:hypothetical protein
MLPIHISGEQCLKEDQCMYWTFMPSQGNCWLKSSNDNQVPKEDRISGAKECPKKGT